MIYLVLFLIGAVVSFIASIPVGAVNMAVVQATLNDRKRSAYMIGLGAILVEAGYAAIPLFGVKALSLGTATFDWMIIGSIPLLIVLGIVTIVRRKKEAKQSMRLKGVEGNPLKQLLYGATLCVVNPFVLVFWAQIVVILDYNGMLEGGLPDQFAFLAGVPAGTYLLYTVFIQISSKTRRFISMRTKVKINVVVGIIFICLGTYLGVNYYVGHHGQLKPGTMQTENNDSLSKKVNLPFDASKLRKGKEN